VVVRYTANAAARNLDKRRCAAISASAPKPAAANILFKRKISGSKDASFDVWLTVIDAVNQASITVN